MNTSIKQLGNISRLFFIIFSLVSFVVGVYSASTLHEAARRGENETVEKILLQKEHLDSVNDFDHYGWTPLFWAVDGGHLDTIRTLLTNGADVNRGREGWSALMWACGGVKAEEITRLLLTEFSADPNVAAANGKTAIMVAASSGNKVVVDLLLANKAAVDASDKEGNTALALAAAEGHVEVMDLLISAGASVHSAGSTSGRPLLSSAAMLGNTAVAEKLIQAGARVDEAGGDDLGTTPLMWAADRGHEKMVSMFLSHSAQVESVRDSLGTSVLSRASRAGRTAVVRTLIAAGADVRSTDNNLWTPLMHAAARGQEGVMTALLEVKEELRGGADLIRAQSSAGETAVELMHLFAPLHHNTVSASSSSLWSRVKSELSSKPAATWDEIDLAMWLCTSTPTLATSSPGSHPCRWAPVFRRAALTGASLFADDTRFPARSALNPDHAPVLEDTVQVLKWASKRGLSSLVERLLAADSPVPLNVNQAFVFATRGGSQENLADILAQHPALDPHSFLPEVNRTALELVSKSTVGGEALRERVRARLDLGYGGPSGADPERRGSSLSEWSRADVVNWIVLGGRQSHNHHGSAAGAGGGVTALLEPIREAGVNGTHLELLTTPLEVDLQGSSILEDGDRVLHWALEASLGPVVLGLARTPKWAHLITGELESGMTLLEHPALQPSAPLHSSVLPELLSLVKARQRSTPLTLWTTAHVVNWLHVLRCGHLAASFRSDGITGSHLETLLKVITPTSSSPRVHNRAMDLKPEALHADGAMLTWSFRHRHRALANQLATAARGGVHTEEGFGSWLAIHRELPSDDDDAEGKTPMEVALEEGWTDTFEILKPQVLVRLLSMPVSSWSHSDCIHWFHSLNLPALAQAARKEESLNGTKLATLGITPQEISKVATNQVVVLKWALQAGLPHLASHCLASFPPHQELWQGSGPALELAESHSSLLSSSLPSLRASALTHLTTPQTGGGGGMTAWAPLQVSMFLALNGLANLAPAFRKDGVTGAQLLRLNTTLTSTSSSSSTSSLSSVSYSPELGSELAASLRDEKRRLLWTAQENLPNLLGMFLDLLTPDQTGPVLLDETDGVPGGGSLLFWIYNQAASRRRILDPMIPSFRSYLARNPVHHWTPAQVTAWLLIGGGRRYTSLFSEAGVTGRQLAVLLGRLNLTGAKAANTPAGEVLRQGEEVLEWALDSLYGSLAQALVVHQPTLAYASLGKDTSLGLALTQGDPVKQAAGEIEDLVRKRMDPTLPRSPQEEDWTRADVANWQYLHQQHKFAKAMWQSNVDGKRLHQLCKPLNITVLSDESKLLSWAISHGYSNIVDGLLASGASALQQDQFGSTLLMDASWGGEVEIVRALLRAGAWVNAQNSNGYTALMRAALRGHTRVVHVLLAFNANPTLKTRKGKTAAMLAASKGYSDLSDLLQPVVM